MTKRATSKTGNTDHKSVFAKFPASSAPAGNPESLFTHDAFLPPTVLHVFRRDRLVVGLRVNDGLLVPEVVPQLIYGVGRDDVPRVQSHYSEHEDTVHAKVIVDKMRQQLLLVPVHIPQNEEVLPNESPASEAQEAHNPHEGIKNVDDGDDDEPKPQEDEDFLVEQVDHQHTLHSVAMEVAKHADLEVTHCDAREVAGFVPLAPLHQVGQDVHPVEGMRCPQELVEQEELRDHVPDVQDLGDEVHEAEVASEALGAHETGAARLDLAAGTASIVALSVKSVLDVPRESAYRFPTVVGIDVLRVASHANEALHVDACGEKDAQLLAELFEVFGICKYLM